MLFIYGRCISKNEILCHNLQYYIYFLHNHDLYKVFAYIKIKSLQKTGIILCFKC